MPLVGSLGKIKVVYFDLDDTLCAYWDAAKKGLRHAFGEHPEHGASLDKLLEAWGDAFTEFVQTIGKTHWYQKYLLSGDLTRTELMRRTLERVGVYDEGLAQAMSDTYYVERHAALELFPESLEVLHALYGHYQLGLITNGPSDIQKQEIQTLNIGPYFQHIFIEGDMGYGKPDPRIFAMATDRAGARPSEVLFVGNSYRHDVVPAQIAGWKTVWIRRPSDVSPSNKTGKPEELPEGATPPDMTITDLREILAP